MPKERKAKNDQQLTTAQQLGSLIKSARDIMRKDKGLNGDLDRLPLLTWVMFLKFLDDMEQLHEQEAMLSGSKYKPDIEKPYRWRDWASPEDGLTGDDLIRFVNQDEAMRSDGKKGMGLLAYLRSLQSANGHGRRDVIANVFCGVQNRMVSGYLLRDVINKINGIHFNSSDEIHTLSHFYETMLKEMRDAAGDSGEFYTPRPVVKFMVEVTAPQLGETVLDPACGTGGFLVEAYEHLASSCKSVKDRRILQQETIFGQEAKPMPYMLVQMNLLLHGLEYPNIKYGNTLAQKITEIGDSERVDVILTNPPFGGEEERGILNNFPADKQTAETALLFLQLIMRKLKRPMKNKGKGGRAAVVVPNGILFGDGVCYRIKEELLKNFNLHTVVRLPEGTFSPYTDIPSNLLFFDRSGPTETIWYYQVPPPEGRKKYTKTMPMQMDDMVDCKKGFIANERIETEHAWRIDFKDMFESAVSEATPHWEAANEAASRAQELERVIKKLKVQIRANDCNSIKKKKLQSELENFNESSAKEREIQAKEQAAGDAIYWSIYNLDHKNPNSSNALEHRPPQELVESILAKENEILSLMKKIKAEVSSLS
jgi:type I restriction enzyme M protein